MKCKAYSTLELSLYITIVGILSISFTSLIHHYSTQHKIKITQYNQQLVSKALGNYTRLHCCLPDAYDTPDYKTTSHCSYGYIPWRELSIDKNITLDGHGKPMLYIVNSTLLSIDQQESFPDSYLQESQSMQDKYSFFVRTQQPDQEITLSAYNQQGQLEDLTINNTYEAYHYDAINNKPQITTQTLPDCVAFTLIGNNDGKSLQSNGVYHVITLNNPKSSSIITFCTRFNIHTYGGPKYQQRLINHKNLKRKLESQHENINSNE